MIGPGNDYIYPKFDVSMINKPTDSLGLGLSHFLTQQFHTQWYQPKGQVILTWLLTLACSGHVTNPRNDIRKPICVLQTLHFTLLELHHYRTKSPFIMLTKSNKI